MPALYHKHKLPQTTTSPRDNWPQKTHRCVDHILAETSCPDSVQKMCAASILMYTLSTRSTAPCAAAETLQPLSRTPFRHLQTPLQTYWPPCLQRHDCPKPPNSANRYNKPLYSPDTGQKVPTLCPLPLATNDHLPSRLADNEREQNTEEQAGTLDITMYSTAWCGYCRKARRWFNDNGYPFVEKDIEKSAQAQSEYRQVSGGYGGVPLIVVNGKTFRGFDQGALLRRIREISGSP